MAVMNIWIYAVVVAWLITIDLPCQNGIFLPAPLVVAETKGVQVKLAPSKVAMGTFNLKFQVNLPSMEIQMNNTRKNCTANLSGTRTQVCKVLHNIDIMSFKILRELETIFDRTENMADLGVKRTRRSLLPILGEGFGWLFGMTTDRELDRTIKGINQIGHNLKDLANSHQTLINATQTNFGILQQHQSQLEANMDHFSKIYNRLVVEVGDFEIESELLAVQIVSTNTLFTKINILQTHLLALRSIYDKCQDHLLPKIVIDERSLRAALTGHQKVLEENALRFVYGVESLSEYYALETATCTLVNKQVLEVTLSVPLTDARSEWRVLEILPLKFLHEGSTCNIVDSPVKIASNGVEIRDLSIVEKFGDLDIFMLPRENSQSQMSNCVHKLLKQANVQDIAIACELSCTTTYHSTVQRLGNDKYSVLNPGSDIAVICNNVVKHKIPTVENGRVEVILPCHCTVQEMSGTQLTLISTVRTCNANLNKNNTLKVNMDWASDNFEPYELFATARSFENLKIKNLTSVPIALVKVETFDGKAISSWQGLPITSSGWVEICLWTVFFVLLFGLLYLYLRFKLPWLAINWCVSGPNMDAPETFMMNRRPSIRPRRRRNSEPIYADAGNLV